MIDGKVGIIDGGPGVACSRCKGDLPLKAVRHTKLGRKRIYCLPCWEKYFERVKRNG